MHISLLHTGEIHAKNFEAIFQRIDPSITVSHSVREDLLDRARANGADSIREDAIQALSDLASADGVLCTCSTLGPATDEASQKKPHIVRVDRPLMEAACEDGADILVAICLESTRDATMALLNSVATETGKKIAPDVVLCADAWPHFEAGETQAYAATIATTIRSAVADRDNTDCIVLGQASMQPAEALLADLNIPVRSSPVLAVERVIATARGQ